MTTETLVSPDVMLKAADTASRLLKTLSHRDRLMILCQLNDGEHSVSQLAEMLDIQQSPLSQHLARMRKEGLVKTRRVAQTIYYSIDSPEASRIIATLYDIFCNPEIS